MSKRSFVVMLSALALAVRNGKYRPKAAETGDSCEAFPGDAVTALPAPCANGAKLSAPPLRYDEPDELTGRALTVKDLYYPGTDGEPSGCWGGSVLTSIAVRDATKKSSHLFLILWRRRATRCGGRHGYRVDFTSVTGNSTTMYFFDFVGSQAASGVLKTIASPSHAS
jgi:hypothetical protein